MKPRHGAAALTLFSWYLLVPFPCSLPPCRELYATYKRRHDCEKAMSIFNQKNPVVTMPVDDRAGTKRVIVESKCVSNGYFDVHFGRWNLVAPDPLHPDAPISRWAWAGHFDSKKDCESGRTTLIHEAGEESRRRLQEFWRGVFLKAQCIATDDPRLKEK